MLCRDGEYVSTSLWLMPNKITPPSLQETTYAMRGRLIRWPRQGLLHVLLAVLDIHAVLGNALELATINRHLAGRGQR